MIQVTQIKPNQIPLLKILTFKTTKVSLIFIFLILDVESQDVVEEIIIEPNVKYPCCL